MKNLNKVFFLILFLILSPLAVATPVTVGPSVWLPCKVINFSSFPAFDNLQGLKFNYFDQDVLSIKFGKMDGDINFDVTFMFVQNDPVSIYLSVFDDVPASKLCKLDLFVDKSGIAKANIKELQPNIIHCQLSGDPNLNNFTLTLTDGWKKMSGKNEK